MNRVTFILFSYFLLLFSSCVDKQPPKRPQTVEGFDITGAWMMVNMTDLEGRLMDMIRNRDFLKCTIYDTDSTYYDVNLWAVEGKTFLFPRESGHYELNDTLLTRISSVTPIRIINDSTMVFKRELWIETWRRTTAITESRKREFIEAMHNNPNKDGEQLHGFVLSTSERKLKHTISAYHFLFITLIMAMLLVVVYAIDLAKHKRRAEENLRAVKEELQQRPTLVANAIRQVENDFFQSDYYQALRLRVAAGENMSDEDWREMESQINGVNTGFTRKLRSLYDFSDIEYHVCLLIKLHISTKEIAAVINRAPDSISSIRNRLHKKVLGSQGGAKEWDDFILSL